MRIFLGGATQHATPLLTPTAAIWLYEKGV